MKAQPSATEKRRSTAGIPATLEGIRALMAQKTQEEVEGNKGTFAEVRRGEALGSEAGGLPGADAGSAGAVMGNTHCFPHLLKAVALLHAFRAIGGAVQG